MSFRQKVAIAFKTWTEEDCKMFKELGSGCNKVIANYVLKRKKFN